MKPRTPDSAPHASTNEASKTASASGMIRSRIRRSVHVAILMGLPLGAMAIAWRATRDQSRASASAAGGHDHSAMARPTGAAGPVMLTDDQARRIGVTFAAVTASPLSREIRTVGQVIIDETRLRTMTAKVDGWVEQLDVDFTGRAVHQGEPLMRIYSPMLVTAQEELLLARRLVDDIAAGTAHARSDAEDLLASARRRLVYWDIPDDEIVAVEREGIARRTLVLRASASGVVVEKGITAGQRFMAGDPLFRVADLSTVWVEGAVYEQDLRAIRSGQSATAEFDAFPGEPWSGRIAYVYPTLSPDTRTARVRVAFANPRLRLKPGMFATLRIAGTSAGGSAPTLTIPRSAVLATGERSLVFVRRADGQLEPRTVTVGAASESRIEVLSGIALGDTVVASATFLIDAESNLGTAMGGMGDMPGMEITLPPVGPAKAVPGNTSQKGHSGHQEHQP